MKGKPFLDFFVRKTYPGILVTVIGTVVLEHMYDSWPDWRSEAL